MWWNRSPKKLIFNFFAVTALLTSYAENSSAASCCGGGFAMPSVITNDDKAQVTTSVSHSQVDTDVSADGVWQKRRIDDSTQLYKIEGSRIFADRYQVGFSAPFLIKSRDGAAGGSSTGLGDVALQLGYEYLPQWSYHPWKPKGVGFVSLTLPTGKSIYESQDGLDSRGRGFFSIGAGTILTKNWIKWDAFSSVELHHSFAKVLSQNQSYSNIVPGNGGSLSLGGGYNASAYRFGGSIAWFYEEAVAVESTTLSEGSAQRYATGTLSLSRMFGEAWAATLGYSDQTLFGTPSNTTLSKSVSLSVQRRWAR